MSAAAIACTLATVALCGAIDARTGLIPNRITYPAAFALLALAALGGVFAPAALGTLAVGGALLALRLLTRRRGLGLGDVKLGACIGAGLGAKLGFVALGSAFVCGGAVGVALLASGRAKRTDPLRFGPYLALGTLLAVLGARAGWNPLG